MRNSTLKKEKKIPSPLSYISTPMHITKYVNLQLIQDLAHKPLMGKSIVYSIRTLQQLQTTEYQVSLSTTSIYVQLLFLLVPVPRTATGRHLAARPRLEPGPIPDCTKIICKVQYQSGIKVEPVQHYLNPPLRYCFPCPNNAI